MENEDRTSTNATDSICLIKDLFTVAVSLDTLV